MSDTRKRNLQWRVCSKDDITVSYDGAQLAVLMDIRDELQKLNGLLHCSNFRGIPASLMAIRKNTNKPPRKPRLKEPVK